LIDNRAAIDWIKAGAPTRKSKHIDVRHYRLKHLLAEGLIDVQYVSSEDNIADILTKVLPVKVFCRLSGMIQGHALVRAATVPGIKYMSASADASYSV